MYLFYFIYVINNLLIVDIIIDIDIINIDIWLIIHLFYFGYNNKTVQSFVSVGVLYFVGPDFQQSMVRQEFLFLLDKEK